MDSHFNFKSVLDFWYEDSRGSAEAFQARRKLWFTASEEFDREISLKFSHYIDAASSGQLTHWEDNAHGALALIIILDQFPRNIFRGNKRAFAYDRQALEVTRNLIESKQVDELGLLEKLFAFLPLEHSEELEVQVLSLNQYDALIKEGEGTDLHSFMLEAFEYARLHYDIIQRFGRFPHRNEILGRSSSVEEIAYLESGAETFGQNKK